MKEKNLGLWRCTLSVVTLVLALGMLLTTTTSWASARHFGPTERFANYSQDPNSLPNIGVEFPPDVTEYKLSWGHYEDPNINDVIHLENPLDDSRFNSYNMIVVVNKNSNREHGPGQTIRVFHRQYRNINDGLIYYWKTSTAKPGMSTPSGFYRPRNFSSMYWSNKYGGSMHWSIFITESIALHSVFDTRGVGLLGNADSHGCIRIQEYRAEHLFHLVGNAGKGLVDEIHGKTGQRTGRKVNSYRTMIVVI